MRASLVVLYALWVFPGSTIGFFPSSLEPTNRWFTGKARLFAEEDEESTESTGRTRLFSEADENVMEGTGTFASPKAAPATVLVAEGDDEIAGGTNTLGSSETTSATVLIAEGNKEIVEVTDTIGSSETMLAVAEAATGAGLAASNIVPIIAPVAALVAARQALTKRDVLREQEAITAQELSRIQKELAGIDTTISASFGVAALTSVIALTNLAGVQYTGPESPVKPPISAVAPNAARKVEKTPKKVEPPAPKTFVRKAPVALRTPVKSKEAQVETDSESKAYDGLLSKLKDVGSKPTESAPSVDKAVDTAQPPAAASFLDATMKKVEEKKAELPKTEKEAVVQEIAPIAEEPKVEAKSAEKPPVVVDEIKKPEETKIAKAPEPVDTQVTTTAVATLPAISVPVIDSGVSAVAVGAGVGVAALGVFAALVAAQDQGSTDKSGGPAVAEKKKKSPSMEASVKQFKKDPVVQKPSSFVDAGPVLPGKTDAISNGKMQMGPLVEERKKQPPKPKQQPPPSMGAMSYIDALSTDQSETTSDANSEPQPRSFAPSAKSKKTVSAPGGGSYLDSL